MKKTLILLACACIGSSAFAGNHKDKHHKHDGGGSAYQEGPKGKGHPHGMPPGLAKKDANHPGAVAFKNKQGQQWVVRDGKVYDLNGVLVRVPDDTYISGDGRQVVVQNGTPTVGQVVGKIVDDWMKK